MGTVVVGKASVADARRRLDTPLPKALPAHLKAALGEKPGQPPVSASKKLSRRPKPPPELEYLLTWYDSCRAGQGRGFEREPLSHQEVLAFRDLHGLQPPTLAEQRQDGFDWADWPEHVMESFDVTMLREVLDPLWMNAQSAKQDAPKPSGGSK